MKTISRWLLIGIAEVIFCFWLLGNAANLVSSPSNTKVWLGVFSYSFGLLILPGASLGYVGRQIALTKAQQKELRQAFPEDETSLLQLLDTRKKR